MKVKISNSHNLISKFIKKSEIADNNKQFRLSSKYFHLANKLYRLSTSELDIKIENNKKSIKERNAKNLSELLGNNEDKQKYIDFLDLLEFPYDIPFGNNPQNILDVLEIAVKLSEKNVQPDVALALAHNKNTILDLIIDGKIPELSDIEYPHFGYKYSDEMVEILLRYIQTRNQYYGFIENRRMDFRTTTLMIDTYLNAINHKNIPQLVANRKEFLDLMYADGEDLTYDMEHFMSALNFNYIFGKNSITFIRKYQEESKEDLISNLPHIIDNKISLSKIEFDPAKTTFIIDNYFKINKSRIYSYLNKQLESLHMTQHLEEIAKDVTRYLSNKFDYLQKAHLYNNTFNPETIISEIYDEIRSDISLVAQNWEREVRIDDDYFLVKDVTNNPLEKISKIIDTDIIAEDIGHENIKNYRLFESMHKYQKDDIKRFLGVQKLVEEMEEPSNWYQDLCSQKVENNSYIAKVMPKDDPRFPFVGAITGCCQKYNGIGHSAFLNTFYPNSGIFIVTDKKDKIVSQSYIWINEKSITLDSIESKNKNLNKEDFLNIHNLACEKIFSKYFDIVLAGNNNTMTRSVLANEKLVPIDLLNNNDPNPYTYDTNGGKSILYTNPESNFPFVSIFKKFKNYLNEPLNTEEIDYLFQYPKIASDIDEFLVDTYIDKLNDYVNKDNTLRLYENIKYNNTIINNISPEFTYLCELFKGKEIVLDTNMGRKMLQIGVNKWFRDGNYEALQQDQNNEKLKTQLKYIQDLIANGYLHNTSLSLAKTILGKFCALHNYQNKDTNELVKYIFENYTFQQFIEKVREEDSNNPDAYPIDFSLDKKGTFVSIVSKYLDENKFSLNDLQIFENEQFIVDNESSYKRIELVNKGLLDLYFIPDENGNVVYPDNISLNNISQMFLYDRENPEYVEKCNTFIQNFYDNYEKTPQAESVNNLKDYQEIDNNFHTFLRNINLNHLTYNFDINNKAIQKLISYSPYLTFSGNVDEKTPEIENIYLSSSKFISKLSPRIKFKSNINLIVDQKNANFDGLYNLNPDIKVINVIAENPEFITDRLFYTLDYKEITVNYRLQDVIQYIENYIDDRKFKDYISYYYIYTNMNPEFFNDPAAYAEFQNIVLKKLDFEFEPSIYHYMKNIDNIKEIAHEIMIKKIKGYFEYLKRNKLNVETILNTPHENLPPRTEDTNPTPENEEQREQTSSHRKIIKYSIKRKL